MNKMALRFAGLGSVVERSATKAAIAQASLSAARGFGKDSALMEPRKKLMKFSWLVFGFSSLSSTLR